MVNSRPDSDASSLSSVSSRELDAMGESSDKGENIWNGGNKKGAKMNVSGVHLQGSAVAKLDNYLASRDNLPSDSDDSDLGIVGGDKGKGGEDYRLADLLGGGFGGDKGKKGGGRGASVVPPPPPINQQRFSRVPPNNQVRLYPESFRSRAATPSPVVPLGEIKGVTVSRVGNPATPGGEERERRKRRPRLDASLRVCRDLITDLLSKKHKDWIWPLYKPDKTRPCNFSNPIYLFDIRNKLSDRGYANSEEFEADVMKLVAGFCNNYPEDNQYHICAKQLKEFIDKEFKKAREADALKPGRGRPRKSAVLGGSEAPRVNSTTVNLTSTPTVDLTLNNNLNSFLGSMALTPWHAATPSWHNTPILPKIDGIGQAIGCENVSSSCARTEHQGRDYGTFGSPNEIGGGIGSQEKRSNEGDSGIEVKRGRVDGGHVDLSLVKEEVDEDGMSENTVLRGTTPSARTNAIKWLKDGINVIPGQDDVLREIRELVGGERGQEFLDLEFLDGLTIQELGTVGDYVVKNLIGGGGGRVQIKDDVGLCSGCRGAASEALTNSQSEWNTMQDDLSSVRADAYEMLKKLNKMQEQTFVNLNNLHDRKGALHACTLHD